ncbi:serine/arginine repetitive matrix protein 1 [Ricinus communis]|uniref:Oxidoreductase, putative n=1 Tax=Ricinus communis TaxID=3988 RepID=B9R7W2_RICCO|nr:serine/arginine repetitive matrix protein 1 [Ricinus communis]EEF52592.1 oxidoreductase, putative [Ricinus communis]|eukprot:XP_002510405.1 serine/arginine repetitive matrix protein 1 [Ricinus communis]
MADQRPFSRFRLPWITAAARPAAEPQPPRPSSEIQAPAQPITTIPQRPFRPGLASIQSPPPPQARAPQSTEPQTPVAIPESRIIVQSPSSVKTQTRAASVPPSPSQTSLPSRAKSEGRVVSQTRSPSRAASQPRAASVPPFRSTQQTVAQPQASPRSASQLAGRTSSQPSPPPRRTTQQPTGSQPPPPLRKLQSTAQETSQPPPSAYRQEPKPEGSSLFSQVAQPTAGMKPLLEPTEREKENGQGKEAPDVLKKEGKTKVPAEEEPKKAITELLTGPMTGSETRELHSVAFSSEQKQHEKEDKKTANRGEHIKTVSATHPKARNKSTESHQKPSMSNGEHVPLHKGIRDDISKFIHKLGIGQVKYPVDEKPVCVMTIAGENTGASMHVGAEPARKDGSIHIHRGYKLNPDDSTGATTDGEGSRDGRSKNPTKEVPVTKAYLNSNTQSVNNSIILDSSVNEQDPGVHLALSHNLAESSKPSAKPEPLETHKTEFNVTRSQKLTYEPTIRRRCLRGLFLEPSDSDNDNPEKPRRHGCLYACGEKSKDKDIGVL